MFKTISDAFDFVEKICFYVSALCAGLIMLMVSSDALARYVFNKPIMGVVEIVEEYLMVMVIFLAMSVTNKTGYHLKVELLERFIPQRMKKVIEPTIIVLNFSIIFLILVASWFSFVRAFKTGELSVGMVPYLLAPAYFFVPFGCALLCIRMFRDFIMCFRNSRSCAMDHHANNDGILEEL